MFKQNKGRKIILAAVCVMLCGMLAACGGEPFEDLEWDDEIYVSDDVLILEPGEEETFSVDNYDCLKNLKVQLDDNTAVADITPGEEFEYTVVAKTVGERVVTFYASYCETVRFRIIVSNDTDKAWDAFYEEDDEDDGDDDDDWDDDDDDDWEDWDDDEDISLEDAFEYNPANYQSEEWNDMFQEETGEAVQARIYNLNVHLEAEDIATFIMADYLDVEAVDLPMANSTFTINKDGTYTMTIDNDEMRNNYIAYLHNIFDSIVLSEAVNFGYTSVEEMAETEGFDNVEELKADRLETLDSDMADQWPADCTGVITYTGYVEKYGEDIYLYDMDGNDLFDSCMMLEDGSISIDIFNDDEYNPIATDTIWNWR